MRNDLFSALIRRKLLLETAPNDRSEISGQKRRLKIKKNSKKFTHHSKNKHFPIRLIGVVFEWIFYTILVLEALASSFDSFDIFRHYSACICN